MKEMTFDEMKTIDGGCVAGILGAIAGGFLCGFFCAVGAHILLCAVDLY